MLVYGMVGWLAAITIGAIIIFAVVYSRLSRAARALDDAETGSSTSSKSSKRADDSPDIGSIPTLYDFDFEASVHTGFQSKVSVDSIDDDSERSGAPTSASVPVRSTSLRVESTNVHS